MTPAPEPNLTAAMLARAGDLATYMAQRGLRIATAAGESTGGISVTVVMAIGEQAEMLLDVAKRVTEHVAETAKGDAGRARLN